MLMLKASRRMLKFKIGVPAEYELDLINALVSLGAVHMHFRQSLLSFSLPPLLKSVAERKIAPQRIDIDEALYVARRNLREGDPLRVEMERVAREERQLSMIESLIKALGDLNLSPRIFREEFRNLALDWFYVDKDVVPSLRSEFSSAGVISSVFSLGLDKEVILVAYRKELANQVEEIAKEYSLERVRLPEWAYGDLDEVFRRIRAERLNLKKEAYEILLELAGLLREAYERERAARVELLESAYRRCREISNNVDLAERILSNVATLKLAKNLVLNKDINTLREMGASQQAIEVIEDIRNGEISAKKIRETIGALSTNERFLELAEDIIAELERLSFFIEIVKGLDVGEETQEIDAYTGGEAEIEEFIKSLEDLKINVAEIATSLGKVIVIQNVDPAVRSSVEFIAGIHNLYPVPLPQPLETIYIDFEKNIEKLNLLITFLALLDQSETEHVVKTLNDERIASLYNRIVALKQWRIKAEHILGESRFQKLKRIIDESENVLRLLNEVGANFESIEGIVEEKYINAVERFVTFAEEMLSYEASILASLKAQSLIKELRIIRNKGICIADGWIPEEYGSRLETTIRKSVPKVIYFGVREISPEEEAPTYSRWRGIVKYLFSLTLMRDVPSYWELDPTIIFSVLFTTMYGLMFGDIGLGAIIALFGLWLYKSKKQILGISREGVESLGILSLLSGISSILFGMLYGIAFLKSIWEPVLVSPIHDVFKMMGIALLFGVIQLIIAMSLNVINYILVRDYLDALFSGTGVLGIIYYVGGVYLAYNIIESGYDLGIAMSPKLLPATMIIFASMALVPISPIIRRILGRGGELMHGIIEFVEMIAAYPANTLSYIRLAAFAMAHEVFGVLAETMGEIVGEVPSFLFANLIVLAIEGFAVGIQALRLTFYEFSTKFFRGGGILYEPLKVALSEEE